MVGTVTSLYDVGCFFGAISGFTLGERLGRKRAILLGTVVMMIGAVIQTTSFSVAQMIAGRWACSHFALYLTLTPPQPRYWFGKWVEQYELPRRFSPASTDRSTSCECARVAIRNIKAIVERQVSRPGDDLEHCRLFAGELDDIWLLLYQRQCRMAVPDCFSIGFRLHPPRNGAMVARVS